jgi:hypothetical protein
MRSAGGRSVLRPPQGVVCVVDAILEGNARGQVLAKQDVGCVDLVDDVAERRIALDPKLDVIAGDELSFAQREQDVLNAHRAFETWGFGLLGSTGIPLFLLVGCWLRCRAGLPFAVV